jgi:hypothetical protein
MAKEVSLDSQEAQVVVLDNHKCNSPKLSSRLETCLSGSLEQELILTSKLS